MSTVQGPNSGQKRILWQALSLLALLFITTASLGIAWVLFQGLKYLSDILIPVGIAVILTYLLHPLVGLLQKLRLSRRWAVVVFFALVAGGIATIALVLGPDLYTQGTRLAQAAPTWPPKIEQKVKSFLDDNSQLAAPLGNVTQKLNTYTHDSAVALLSVSGVGKLIHTAAFVLGLVFIPFYLFYFLSDQPKIERKWRDYLPLRDSAFRREVVVVLEQINKYMISFFRGQIVVAASDGAMIAIGLAIIGVDYALLIGAAACLLTIIPYFGIITTCLVTFLVAGFQDNGGAQLVGLSLLVFAIVQTLENTVISPRVMNERTGLHPVTVLLSILVWSSILGGLLGAILAVPLTATLKVLLARYALIKKDGETKEADAPAATHPSHRKAT